jgi:hypothetical protein
MSTFRNLVEDVFNEMEGYNIEVGYGEWPEWWDGHDDSTEPEQPDYIRYRLIGRAFEARDGKVVIRLPRDMVALLDNLNDWAAAGENLADFLVEGEGGTDLLVVQVTKEGKVYEDTFCNAIADIFNDNAVMGKTSWYAKLV